MVAIELPPPAGCADSSASLSCAIAFSVSVLYRWNSARTSSIMVFSAPSAQDPGTLSGSSPHSQRKIPAPSASAPFELIALLGEQDVEAGQRSVAAADVALELHLDVRRELRGVDLLFQRAQPVPDHDDL